MTMSYFSEQMQKQKELQELYKAQMDNCVLGMVKIANDINASEDDRNLAALTLYRRLPQYLRHAPNTAIKREIKRLVNLFKCSEYQRKASLTSDGRARKLFQSAKRRSKQLGVPFDLDVEWISEKIASGKCEVTSIPFVMSCPKGRQRPFSPSLDRFDPKRGYTKDNVRVVVWIHNLAKSDFDEKDVVTYANAIASMAIKVKH